MNPGKQLIVLIGSPGAGKGSISMRAIQELGWVQLSTGNLCRKHIAEQTEIGKQIDFALKSGKLVSDSLISRMVGQWIAEHSDGGIILLDGYPRTVAQGQHLSDLLQDQLKDWKLTVIRLVLSDEQVIMRLSGRYVCENKDCQAVYSVVPGSSLAPKKANVCDVCLSTLTRRNDDNSESIRERLIVYHQHEGALLDFYRSNGQVIQECDVDKPFDDVFADFKRIFPLEGA